MVTASARVEGNAQRATGRGETELTEAVWQRRGGGGGGLRDERGGGGGRRG